MPLTAPYPKPARRPHNARFSSGPCAKRPDWSFRNLDHSVIGRSHRSAIARKMMKEIVDKTRLLLSIPDDFAIGLTPGSATGAMELALWNLLGVEGIGCDVFAWEQFSALWRDDVMTTLKIPDARAFEAPYGQLPDFNMMLPDRDAIFVWNGTASGACIPNGSVIPKGDRGLRFCDATSAVFMYELPWDRLDVVTWSWQKCLGGEAAHGVIALGPKALARLRDHTPPWPVPKLFQMTGLEGRIEPFFEGVFINTPSMICMADTLDALEWADAIGGRPAIQQRMAENAQILDEWVKRTPWIEYLTAEPAHRSRSSVCLRYTGERFDALEPARQKALAARIVALLEQEQAGYDLNAFKTAPAGLRIWCGTTIEPADIRALCPWLEWAWHTAFTEINTV